MGRLLLVRHGQASFFSQNYDQLSELGASQARTLGRWWATRGLQADAVFVGPLQRHEQTWEQLRLGLEPLSWPAALPEPGLDEYPAFQVMALAVPALASQDPEFAQLQQHWEARSPQASKSFQIMLERVTHLWIKEQLSLPEHLTWRRFKAQTRSGLDRMLRHPQRPGATLVGVTSAGTIAAIAGIALDLRDEKILELSWVLRNTSQAEFFFSSSSGRFTLSSLNDTAHLTDPDMVTLR